LLWLVALALFGSLISLYYYLIVLKVIFVDEPSRSTAQRLNGSTSDLLQRITVSLPAAAVLFLGVLPGPLVAQIVDALR
jgi:NADH:ubiquinone oxidoreductase subunit 2 (subunit N)